MSSITVKNKTNWFVTIVFGFGLLLTSFIIFILIPLSVFQEDSALASIFSYTRILVPFGAFFVLFLYFWLWNTFGKTVLEFDSKKIVVTKKYKLFNTPKIYYRSEIQKIDIEDFRIERTQYNVRYHFSWSDSTFSLIFIHHNLTIRIVDWLTYEKAKEVLNMIQ